MAGRSYNLQVSVHIGNAQVNSNCNAISFLNSGSTDATVNGVPVAAGGSFGYDGLKDETDTTVYSVVFTGNAGSMHVIRKTYV